MLQYILFDTTLFGSGDSTRQARQDITWLLEALTQRNQSYLRYHPATPRLYKSGVKYQVPLQFDGDVKEVKILRDALGRAARQRDVEKVLETIQAVMGGERFRDIGRILENGGGDCDNLAAWRAAELREAGIPARPCMTHRTTMLGNTIYHALVLWPPMAGVALDASGRPQPTSEDPSLLLGMSQPERAADRAEEIRKNQERCEILQQQGLRLAGAQTDLDAALSEVMGARRQGEASAIKDIERLLKEAA